MQKTLIYGYGNPGRKDDGLGARFIEKMEEWIAEQQITNISTDCNYQLNIEDAADIADYDRVIFVDASVLEIEDFKLEELSTDSSRIEFTMHAVSPAYVLDLCNKIYNKQPEAYVLHIRGYEWDFEESLSEAALSNLNAAFDFLKKFLKK